MVTSRAIAYCVIMDYGDADVKDGLGHFLHKKRGQKAEAFCPLVVLGSFYFFMLASWFGGVPHRTRAVWIAAVADVVAVILRLDLNVTSRLGVHAPLDYHLIPRLDMKWGVRHEPPWSHGERHGDLAVIVLFDSRQVRRMIEVAVIAIAHPLTAPIGLAALAGPADVIGDAGETLDVLPRLERSHWVLSDTILG
jgi:hypothetical protein